MLIPKDIQLFIIKMRTDNKNHRLKRKLQIIRLIIKFDL